MLFEQLISVSGVGPRVALGLLSALDGPQLATAIVGGRADVLRKVPGVGQKTAERIVLDLRDKVTPPAAGVESESQPRLGQRGRRRRRRGADGAGVHAGGGIGGGGAAARRTERCRSRRRCGWR